MATILFILGVSPFSYAKGRESSSTSDTTTDTTTGTTASTAAGATSTAANTTTTSANSGIQMLPPSGCATGVNGVLTWDMQHSLQCSTGVTVDNSGDVAATGSITLGQNSGTCNATTNVGTIRYNPSTKAFEGCSGDGNGWESLGGAPKYQLTGNGGYINIGGLIIQFGNLTTGYGPTLTNYPIPFPNAVLSLITSANNNDAWAGGEMNNNSSFYAWSAYANGGGGTYSGFPISYIAIGY